VYVRRFGAPVLAFLSLSLAAAAMPGATAAPHTIPETFVGLDGLIYAAAPPVVLGVDDELFAGWEFDYACGLGGKTLDKWITQMGKLAAVLERSGRRVVYTVAPGKTWGLSERLDPSTLPQGTCDTVGVAQQNKVLDEKRPSYLPLRPLLSDGHHQMYWKTDPHWTTVGASRFARGVAAALDPRLGREQRYTYTTETRWGGLAQTIGDPTPEVGERAIPRSGVEVRSAQGARAWSGYPSVVFDTSWRSSPSRRTWPGRTVLLGDSFMWYALESLRPVFRSGRFIWLGHVDDTALISSIVHSDTVVMEAYAAFGSALGLASFRREVKKALGERA
jgi:hypothetical protein